MDLREMQFFKRRGKEKIERVCGVHVQGLRWV
jgi:hypothetical protein